MLLKKKNKNQIERELVAVTTPQSLVTEQFRRLRTNLNFSSDQNIQSLIVTSASASDGKSTVAANLAVVYAQEGKKVLLVDSDLRNPTAHKTFSMQNDIGISSILNEQTVAEGAIRKTFVKNLDLLSSGPIPSNPSELLASNAMEKLMDNLKKSYDFIIFDSPPILLVVDGQIIANKCDGSIIVINSGKTDKKQALKVKEVLTASGSKLIGVILNNYKQTPEKGYY